MKNLLITLSLLLFMVTANASEMKNISIQEAMQKLEDGNARFVEMKLEAVSKVNKVS